MLLKEHRFTFVAGAEVQLLRIEELAGGAAFWPHRFRLKLPATCRSEAKTIYGKSCDEVAQRAAEVMAREAGREETAAAKRLFAGPPPAAPRTLQIQQ